MSTRILLAHPKQGWDDERIRDAVSFIETTTGAEVIAGREAYKLYFSACGRNWDRWARRVGGGTELDGTPLFDVIVVPGDTAARATAQICEAALDAGRTVLSWDTEENKFVQVRSIRDEQPHNHFFGWRLCF